MATLGLDDLKGLATPALWDLPELRRVQMQEGQTFDQVVRDVQGGIGALNASLLTLPHYGDMLAVQDTPELEYPIGVSNGVEDATEYSVPTPKRGATTGHMLPLKPFDRSLGWTMMYLQKARRNKLDADVRSAVTDMRNHWQKKLLERFFKAEGETVGVTANASVPFVDAAATDTTYKAPDSPEGKTFATSHSHLLRTTPLDAAAVTTAMFTIREHGHLSPFEIIASEADAATWKGMTGYKSPEWPGIVYHSSAGERAAIPDNSIYFGYIETSMGIGRIWLTPRLPTNYFGTFKAYGSLDPRNPLRVRIDRTSGFGWRLIPGVWANAPQLVAVMWAEFGVGIGEDRTNGVLTYINAAGNYVTPTIT
jgi:hypothetical protein